jgi:hypothetical protein
MLDPVKARRLFEGVFLCTQAGMAALGQMVAIVAKEGWLADALSCKTVLRLIYDCFKDIEVTYVCGNSAPYAARVALYQLDRLYKEVDAAYQALSTGEPFFTDERLETLLTQDNMFATFRDLSPLPYFDPDHKKFRDALPLMTRRGWINDPLSRKMIVDGFRPSIDMSNMFVRAAATARPDKLDLLRRIISELDRYG